MRNTSRFPEELNEPLEGKIMIDKTRCHRGNPLHYSLKNVQARISLEQISDYMKTICKRVMKRGLDLDALDLVRPAELINHTDKRS